MNNEKLIKLPKQVEEITSQLETKANLSDVAKISSGTPLFASSVSGMTDTTKNYVNTTDGYLYIYSSGSWTKTTVQYQSTGIQDNTVYKRKTTFSDEIFGSEVTIPIDLSQLNTINATINKNVDTFSINKIANTYGWIFNDTKKIIKLNISSLSGWFVCLVANDTECISVSLLPANAGRVARTTTTTSTTLISENTVTKHETLALNDDVLLIYDDYTINAKIKKNGTTEYVPYFSIDIISLKSSLDVISKAKLGFMVFANATVKNIETSLGNCIEQKVDIMYKEFKTGQTTESKYSVLNWAIGGDSISKNNGGEYGDYYPTLVNNNLRFANVDNKAEGGSRIAKREGSYKDEYALSSIYNTYDANADIITIFAGTNDYQGKGVAGVPIGAKGSTNQYEFYGALKILIEGLISKYPTKKIGFITPLRRTDDNIANLQGHKLIEYVNAIIDMCNEYSLPVLDLYRCGGINFKNNSYLTTDGLHPNKVGNIIISDKIECFIRTL